VEEIKMRELLATIRVYKDEEEENPSHSLQVGKSTWEITLSPKFDAEILKAAHASSATEDPLKQNETILSHELGHVVAHIFKDPTHANGVQVLAHLMNTPFLLTPAEKQAWVNAEEIFPKGDKRIEKLALESYGG
jgi:hypothetical protein